MDNKTETDIKIYKSQIYEDFVFLNRNRSIKENHVKELVNAIIRDNRLHLNPIKVTISIHKNNVVYSILDGQHRFKAAKILNVPIYFIINENVNEYAIPDDQISKKWTYSDWYNYYMGIGNKSFIELDKLMIEHDFQLTEIFCIIKSFDTTRDGGKKFREGKIEFSEELIEFLDYIRPYYARLKSNHSYLTCKRIFRHNFLSALTQIFRNEREIFYKFMDKLEYRLFDIPDTHVHSGYVGAIQSIALKRKNKGMNQEIK